MSKKQPKTFWLQVYSVLLLLMMVWLTVCLPYVNQSQCVGKAQVLLLAEQSPDGDGGYPLTNSNEETSETGASLLQEYLHNLFFIENAFTLVSSVYNAQSFDLYLAFHPDCNIPPPELW